MKEKSFSYFKFSDQHSNSANIQEEQLSAPSENDSFYKLSRQNTFNKLIDEQPNQTTQNEYTDTDTITDGALFSKE